MQLQTQKLYSKIICLFHVIVYNCLQHYTVQYLYIVVVYSIVQSTLLLFTHQSHHYLYFSSLAFSLSTSAASLCVLPLIAEVSIFSGLSLPAIVFGLGPSS